MVCHRGGFGRQILIRQDEPIDNTTLQTQKRKCPRATLLSRPVSYTGLGGVPAVTRPTRLTVPKEEPVFPSSPIRYYDETHWSSIGPPRRSFPS